MVSVSRTVITNITYISRFSYSKGLDAVDRPSTDHKDTTIIIQNISRGTTTNKCTNNDIFTELVVFWFSGPK